MVLTSHNERNSKVVIVMKESPLLMVSHSPVVFCASIFQIQNPHSKCSLYAPYLVSVRFGAFTGLSVCNN